MSEEAKYAAVYTPLATLNTALDILAKGIIPNQIDRSTYPGFSWGMQNQLLAGMKFLGLIEENGKPTTDLHELATADQAKRKAKLRDILREKYKELFALDLMKMTPNQLNESMAAHYGVSGDTRDKAVRFFLSALTYVGEPVSPFLIGKATSNGGATKTRRRASSRPRAASMAPKDDPEDVPPPQPGQQRVVSLQSGGTLMLSATVDFFSMSQGDRAFVFKLIDEMEKYEKGTDLV